MNLSDHFTLAELTFSEVALRRGIVNEPDVEQIDNLMNLAEQLLEPARTLLAVPLHINSGFRSKVLNKLIGGAVDSVHPRGNAVDLLPVGFPLRDAFDVLRLSKIPYDQIILECDAWIHLSNAGPSGTRRRQALTASGTPGHWVYELVA